MKPLASKKQIQVLSESVSKVVKMLVSRDIEVTQEGSSAYVKYDDKTRQPVRVNIPVITEDSPVVLVEAIQGFIDSEVGHALFSDGMCYKQAEQDNILGLYDIADDIMVESRMNALYRGSRSNMSRTYDHYLDNVAMPKIEKLKTEGADEVQLFLEGYAIPAIRAWGGQDAFQEFMKERWSDIESIAKKIPQDLKDELAFARNSEDALKASTRLAKILVEQPPESSDDDSGDDDGQGNDSAAGQSGVSNSSDNKDEGDNADSTQEQAVIGGNKGDDKGDGEQSGSGATQSGGNADDESEGQAIRDEVQHESVEWPSGFNDMETMSEGMREYICDMAGDANKGNAYKPFTTRLDLCEVFDHKANPVQFDSARERLDAMVEGKISMLAKNLERVIVARSKRQYIGGFKSGRIHTSNLYRLSLNDDRVFRRKHESTTKDIAAQIIVDCSGSMRGGRYYTALASGYGICKALDKLGINNEMCGFTTHSGNGPQNDYWQNEKVSELRAASSSEKGNFNRFEPLYLPIFKQFSERMQSVHVRDRIINAMGMQHYLANNIDGESIQIHSARLMAQPQKGKLMIVLSDGSPAASAADGIAKHLRDVVKELTAAGVSVFGVGIQSSSVNQFYDHCKVISDIEELPAVIGDTLRQLILKQMGS